MTNAYQIDSEHLRQWIGRNETLEDYIQPSAVARWLATFAKDRDARALETLPHLAHWMFFAPQASHAELNKDGHPKLGGFLPPVPLPRRMWAGGKLTFRRALRVGTPIHRETRIEDVAVKEGRQGVLVFLKLHHRILDSGGVAIDEQQDIVYREPPTATAGIVAPAGPAYDGPPAEWEESLTPDEAMLFRYSALTFNAHRIHYDLPYARDEEGYPSLVVQGPLTASLLMNCAVRWLRRPPVSFTFRGVSPLFVNEPVRLCARREPHGLSLWALGPNDRVGMTATASLLEE